MKFGYILIQPQLYPNQIAGEPTWRSWLPSLFGFKPVSKKKMRILLYLGDSIYNLRAVSNLLETTLVPYSPKRATTFPQRILFMDTCMMLEHYDPLTHNNCDPHLATILGEHPEFLTCLSSHCNGSYTYSYSETSSAQPVFSVCRVKNNPDTTQKYIFAYDDQRLQQINVITLLYHIFTRL